MNRRLLLIALACAAVASGCDSRKNGATGPTPAPPGAATTISFETPRKASGDLVLKVITNGNSPFWDSMGKGLTVGLAATHATGGWTAPQQPDNSSQKQVFEQAMSANADGIAVSTIEPAAFTPVIDDAISKGVPVITFDSDAPDSKRLAYIGTDNYQAGVRAGEQAVKLMPNGAKFVAFVGNMSADNAKQRYQGFLDAVKGHNIEPLQAPAEDNKDAVGAAHRNVADAITRYGDKLTLLVGLYSYNGPAIVDAVMQAGIRNKVKIVCFDGEPRTLDNLTKGLVDVTVVQKPYEFGRLSAMLLAGINRVGLTKALEQLKPECEKLGMKIDMGKHIIDTGVTVITPANAAAFVKDLHDKGLSST